jgi:nucleotide-binding universal stress UspA family protein
MRTIIAPTDFFSISRNAVNYAADMALQVNAKLILFHVAQIPFAVAEVPASAIDFDKLVSEAEQQLAEIKSELSLRMGNKLIISIKAVVGSIEAELEALCKVKKPFAVVMGSERTTNAGGFFLGSNTLAAVKKLPATIFVIPPSARFCGIKKIVLASDLNEVYKMPVEILGELLNIFNASLDIVHIAKKEADMLIEAVPVSILQQRLKNLNPNIECDINQDVKQGIEVYAKKHEDDAILMLPKKHSFFDSLLHGSQAKKIVLNPALPIITLGANV